MTVERVTWIAVLGMAVTAAAVYALTAPPSAVRPSEVPSAPVPLPSDTAPTSSTPSPPVPSDTAPTSSATAPPAPVPAPTALRAPTGSTFESAVSVASAALAAFAKTEAPGMATEGPSLTAILQQGGTKERSFRIEPGRCYAVLAVGVGITELDIKLIGPPPGGQVATVLANDTSTGSRAALGGRGNCYRWSAAPVAAKFEIKATAGQGVAVAQLFVK